MTRSLHWFVFSLLFAQLAVGYLMTWVDESDDGAAGALSDERLLGMHMSLGAVLLVLAVIRLAWRVLTPLPAWAETLTPFERRYAHRVEQALYLVMFAIPITGMLTVMADGERLSFFGVVEVPSFFSEDSDLEDVAVALHVAGHIAFFALLALHVGLVLKHQVVNRDGLLRRMF